MLVLQVFTLCVLVVFSSVPVRADHIVLCSSNGSDDLFVVSEDESRNVVLERLEKATTGQWRVVDNSVIPLPDGSKVKALKCTSWGSGRAVLVASISSDAQADEVSWHWFSYQPSDGNSPEHWERGLISHDGLLTCIDVQHVGGDSIRCLFHGQRDGSNVFVVYRNECISFGLPQADTGQSYEFELKLARE